MVGALIAALVLVPSAWATTFTKVALINGPQAGNASPGSGCARLEVDTVTNRVTYRIVFSGLTAAETVAHFHGPADPGVNGGVLEPLPLGSPKVGTWAYAEAQEADILAGKVYINIHSAAFPGGEIRGQVVDLVAEINGAQQVPPVALPGSGCGLFNVDTCANTLSYYIAFSGLSAAETVAHIHGTALHGTNAGVLHPLALGSPKIGAWTYPETLEEAILDGRTYVNIHSATFPGGELRGQIVRLVAPIDGLQVVGPVATPGSGCAQIAVDRAANTLSYQVTHRNLTAAATAGHIHGFAPVGVNAGVVLNIGAATPNVGTWAYGAANSANVQAGLTYVQIHTGAFPGGEIRGQVRFPAPPCLADLDCNGTVGFADLNAILAAWGPCAGCPEDLDNDGNVGFVDLNLALGAWGPCP